MIKQLWRALGRPHPLFFLTVYVVSIPFFALIYYRFDGEFYQSTYRLDKSVMARRASLSAKMGSLIVKVFKPPAWLGGRWSTNNIRVDDLEATSTGLRADVIFTLVPPTGQSPFYEGLRRAEIDRAYSWPSHWRFLQPAREENRCLVFFAADDMPETLTRELAERRGAVVTDWGFGAHGRFGEGTGGSIDKTKVAGYWELDCGIIGEMQEFMKVDTGMTLSGWGTYSRFVYFSVVTLTTLGYGDIVPISDRARGLVSLQSVFGVVVIGLFLNSLGARLAERIVVGDRD
ncbi:MAG: potassium channel family protein [Thermoanaerobaculia bacterium]